MLFRSLSSKGGIADIFNFKVKKNNQGSRKKTLFNPKEPASFYNDMASSLEQTDQIDSALYPKYRVKRGLRNANGTGVIVGLTKIGEVQGYTTDENKNKLPVEGNLFYRGYEIRDLVKNCTQEDRFGFEEIIIDGNSLINRAYYADRDRKSVV